MSMWLSGVNSAMGSARGQLSARARQQGNALMAEGTRQVINFWTGALEAPKTARLKSKKRKIKG